MVVTHALVLLAGLVGGAVGAAVGARTVFGIAGGAIVVGELLAATSGEDALESIEVLPAPVDAPAVTATVGFGPLLGPHVAFAGGAAAAAYAGRKRTIDTGFRYHQAKQIAVPLYESPRTLAVGAVFGLLGVIVASLAAGVGAPLDPVALAVVVSALCHRLALGYPVLGRLRGTDRSVFDVSPFEESAYWGDDDHQTAQGIGGRQIVEPWQPDYDEWPVVLALGAVGGVAAGVLASATGSAFVAFGLAAVALAARSWVDDPIPAVHHVALPAGIAAVAMKDPLAGLLVALGVGVVAAVLGELAGRFLYAHGDSHLDPGFVSILLTSVLVVALVGAGIFDAGAVPYPTG